MNLSDIRKMCAPARIVAVSKLQSTEKIRALYEAGQLEFGENYVQEALKKITELNDLPHLEWHLIGHLQKNKVKSIVGKFKLIHSVDSLELAQAISKTCTSLGINQSILIQVNIAKETSKGGFEKEQLLSQWGSLTELPNLKIFGLMTMPPLTENHEELRLYFSELRELMEKLKTKTDLKSHPLTELSMGTSHDFVVAIEQGATIVRLGTILFGERPAKL